MKKLTILLFGLSLLLFGLKAQTGGTTININASAGISTIDSNTTIQDIPTSVNPEWVVTLDTANDVIEKAEIIHIDSVNYNDLEINGVASLSGGMQIGGVIKGSDYTATSLDNIIEMTNATDTLTLPTGITNQTYTCINVSAGNITIIGTGGEQLGNASPAATITASTGEAYRLWFDGTIWRVF